MSESGLIWSDPAIITLGSNPDPVLSRVGYNFGQYQPGFETLVIIDNYFCEISRGKNSLLTLIVFFVFFVFLGGGTEL